MWLETVEEGGGGAVGKQQTVINGLLLLTSVALQYKGRLIV